MTGPAVGKIRVGGKEITFLSSRKIERDVDVYIHLKGYSLARVTHLDVEYGEFWKHIEDGFMKIVGVSGGILVIPKDKKVYCKVLFEFANEIVGINEETWGFVGRKEGDFILDLGRNT